MKLKRDAARFLGFLLSCFIALTVIFGAYIYPALATPPPEDTPPRYMLLMEGGHGLNFYCLDSLPYEITGEQAESEWRGFAGNPNLLTVQAQLIEVETCNLSVIYGDENGRPFVWKFTERVTDEHPDHRHITGGAYWIRWISIEGFP